MDLNADLGEGIGSDEGLLRIVTSANIACGGHAGSVASMAESVERAQANGVVIGAHPSYPDRAGFGRQKIAMTTLGLAQSLREQVGELFHVARKAAATVRYLKPHGALYHAVLNDREHADALVTIAAEYDLPLLLAPQAPAAKIGEIARELGVVIHGEGFVDRGYSPAGFLLDRAHPQALVSEPERAVSQALSLARGRAPTITGESVQMVVSSLCVHGDTPGAVQIAASVRAGLLAAGVPLGAWSAQ